MPESYNRETLYPVVYTTDGQLITASYKTSLDSLIKNKCIKPVVVIGVNSDETLCPDGRTEHRNYEYIQNLYGGKDSLNLLFDKHLQFFSEEIFSYVESKYSVLKSKANRYFYGISNGADFGVTLAQLYPDLIGTYLLCSIVSGSKIPFAWNSDNCPSFFLATGNEEYEGIREEAIRLSAYLAKIGIPFQLQFYTGGHERKLWEKQFIQTLPKMVK